MSICKMEYIEKIQKCNIKAGGEDMYKEVFALRLRQSREELNLSQLDVSKELCINQSKLSKYETGALEPNLETLGKAY